MLRSGIRVNAFASGGLLPAAVRGTKLEALATIWEYVGGGKARLAALHSHPRSRPHHCFRCPACFAWASWYGTFLGLAGVDPTDARAAAAGLPPVDSQNLWPVLSGATAVGPRTEIALGSCANARHDPFCQGGSPGDASVNGIIALDHASGGLFKLVRGLVPEAVWTGPQYPNGTGSDAGHSLDCGAGCLFNLNDDPTEHVNLNASAGHVDLIAALNARIEVHQQTVFSPDRGSVDPASCAAALHEYSRFWGPWLK